MAVACTRTSEPGIGTTLATARPEQARIASDNSHFVAPNAPRPLTATKFPRGAGRIVLDDTRSVFFGLGEHVGAECKRGGDRSRALDDSVEVLGRRRAIHQRRIAE